MSSLSDNFCNKKWIIPILTGNQCMHDNVNACQRNTFVYECVYFIFRTYVTLKELTEKPQVKTFQLCICEANTNSLGVSYIAFTNNFVKSEQAKEKFSIL